MRTVYKYIIPSNEDNYYLNLPIGSEILYAREQGNDICVWALVNTKKSLRTNRVIRLAGTGHPLDDTTNYIYLGSAHLHGGSLIIHVFEEVV